MDRLAEIYRRHSLDEQVSKITVLAWKPYWKGDEIRLEYGLEIIEF